ncbi:MAG: hypothetical protein K2P51_01485 [Rhabdochlamydiaceae bacterium]|nr:hypothetical protein [Rhabdochlamydiaceae bacterium]
MNNLYSQLVKDTLRFLNEQPQDRFELVSLKEHAFFPKTKDQSPHPLNTPQTPQLLSKSEYAKEPLLKSPQEKPCSSPCENLRKENLRNTTPLQTPALQARSIAAPQLASSEIQKTLEKIAPHMRLSNEIPDDAVAKRIASSWQEKIPEAEVVLLLLDPSKESVEFLKNLAKAIHTQLCPAKVISAARMEQEKRWDLFLEKNAFRLIIATEGLKHYPDLIRYYKALPSQNEAFLGKIPFISLSPATTYLASPEHKALLWKKVCQICKKQ